MDHDHSYKLLFSHPEMVEDLLRGFVREDWVLGLDFSTLEKMNNSYVADDLRGREDDLIWRVRWGREWLYIYLLLEFQSTIDRYMAARIFSYLGLLYQDLIRTKQLTADGRLPPVLPVVLYNGTPPWDAPEDLADLIMSVPGGLERYRPRMRYLLLDEGRYSEQDLAPLRNLVAALFRMENSRTPGDVEQVLSALIDWLKLPQQDSLRRAFTVWVKRVFLPGRMPHATFTHLNELQEVQSMLAERVIEWTEEWKRQGLEQGLEQGLQKGLQKGLQQGRQEGRQEGEAALLLRLLERRFGTLDEPTRQRVRAADAETLLQWGERILTAATLTEVVGE